MTESNVLPKGRPFYILTLLWIVELSDCSAVAKEVALPVYASALEGKTCLTSEHIATSQKDANDMTENEKMALDGALVKEFTTHLRYFSTKAKRHLLGQCLTVDLFDFDTLKKDGFSFPKGVFERKYAGLSVFESVCVHGTEPLLKSLCGIIPLGPEFNGSRLCDCPYATSDIHLISAMIEQNGGKALKSVIRLFKAFTINIDLLNAVDKGIKTALHYLAIFSYADCTVQNLHSFLLEKGVNPTIPDGGKKSPFHVVAERHDVDAVAFVLETLDLLPSYADVHGRTPLHYAATSIPCMDAIVAKAKTPSVASFLESCLFQPDLDHLLPISIAFDNGLSDNVFRLGRLMNTCPKKPDGTRHIDAVDQFTATPLIHAVITGKLHHVFVIVRIAKADVNATDSNGLTPLMHACACQRKRFSPHRHLSLVQLLILYGANCDQCDTRGATAIHYAIRNDFNECALALVGRLLYHKHPQENRESILLFALKQHYDDLPFFVSLSRQDITIETQAISTLFLSASCIPGNDKKQKIDSFISMWLNHPQKQFSQDPFFVDCPTTSINKHHAEGVVTALKFIIRQRQHAYTEEQGIRETTVKEFAADKENDVFIHDSEKVSLGVVSFTFTCQRTGKHDVSICQGIPWDTSTLDETVVKNWTDRAKSLVNVDLPCVEKVLGCIESPGQRLVLEERKGATLFHWLYSPSQFDKISYGLILLWALDISSSLYSLHAQAIYHGNITSNTVLVTDSMICKLTDLDVGERMLLYTGGRQDTLSRLPFWSAPELFLGKVTGPNVSTDIFSFGILLYEMYHRSLPYGRVKDDYSQICRDILDKKRSIEASIAAGCPRSLKELIFTCCIGSTEERHASFGVVFEKLLHMADEYQEKFDVPLYCLGKTGRLLPNEWLMYYEKLKDEMAQPELHTPTATNKNQFCAATDTEAEPVHQFLTTFGDGLNPNIRVLKLDGTDLSSTELFERLLTGIQHTKQLRKLSVVNCNLTFPLFKLLAKQLVELRTLHELDLSHNKLGNDACPYLAVVCKKQSRLVKLTLFKTGVSGRGLRSLFQEATWYKKLKEFSVGGNPLTLRTAKWILGFLASTLVLLVLPCSLEDEVAPLEKLAGDDCVLEFEDSAD